MLKIVPLAVAGAVGASWNTVDLWAAGLPNTTRSVIVWVPAGGGASNPSNLNNIMKSTYSHLAVVSLNSTGNIALFHTETHYILGIGDSTEVIAAGVTNPWPVTLAPSGATGWKTIDLSADIPATATGVFIVGYAADANSKLGVRTPTCTTALINSEVVTAAIDRNIFFIAGVDSSRQVEVYHVTGNTQVYTLVYYFTTFIGLTGALGVVSLPGNTAVYYITLSQDRELSIMCSSEPYTGTTGIHEYDQTYPARITTLKYSALLAPGRKYAAFTGSVSNLYRIGYFWAKSMPAEVFITPRKPYKVSVRLSYAV